MFRSHFFLALFATLPYRGFFFLLSLLITPKVVVCLLVEQKVTLLTRFRLFLSKQWVEGGGRFEQNILINFLSCSTDTLFFCGKLFHSVFLPTNLFCNPSHAHLQRMLFTSIKLFLSFDSHLWLNQGKKHAECIKCLGLEIFSTGYKVFKLSENIFF